MACETILPVPVDCPITIYIGTTFGPLLVKIVNDASGDPVNLAGYAAEAKVRVVAQYPTIYVDLLPLITNELLGQITIVVDEVTTGGLVPMDCVWDLILVNTNGKRIGPFVGGAVSIRHPVSRV